MLRDLCKTFFLLMVSVAAPHPLLAQAAGGSLGDQGSAAQGLIGWQVAGIPALNYDADEGFG
jgi:hypothetical protein